MIIYKILHKPSGMFYKPSKHRSKVNLSEKGKSYESKPSLKWIQDGYRHPIGTKSDWENRTFIPEDWEIVEYRLCERGY